METLDGFILNIFRTEKPVLTTENFEEHGIWVCDYLEQDTDVANEYIKFRLSRCKDRMEKLQFLYETRSCLIAAVENLEELNKDEGSKNNPVFRKRYDKYYMVFRQALNNSNTAIQHYLDCKQLECIEPVGGNKEYSNSQQILIYYYFFVFCGIEPRKNVDVSTIAKFIHLATGKEFTKLTSSDFYKKLQTAPNFKSDASLISDLQTIKPLFERVELKEIVKLIDAEIALAKKEIKAKA